ncbi:nuclear transport factor 2 family protein [Roseobacter sp. CCS2]|uniref:nuclear transport factor 2 family protein n=1 Tax=Roseobacter sp. CCS2 TaxID=391593 RepID=UPI0000F3E442|nr:nuclear transport factor 2 family protein [Roseobacter sp. CCS2]EBA12065.1 hypothetical protein RCCS2_12249 [Roseobacter sp. CCS2]
MKRTALALALLATPALVSPAAADDRNDIIAPITAIAAGADRHDWDRVRAAFADEVTLDYTSLWGGDPATQTADAVVEQWSGFLPGFETTHHMVTNHTVTSASDVSATVEADFTATHRIGDDLWVLGGRYDYDLIEVNGDWKVSSMTMTALWETGDRGLVGQAAERAAATQ